ncbi:hypothetical protein LUZ60_000229 [Juncus effusus]|nr:hypothetical protein LUZ60_000229 [Juncus effusus]
MASSSTDNEIKSIGEMTPLQKHASFFDRNKDGVIYPGETYRGMRAIGAGIGLSAIAGVVINALLSSKTLPEGRRFSLRFPIYIENIQKAKHGSDTDTYDSEGRFVPEKFEEIFKKYAKTNPNALTKKELDKMIHANREPKDYIGWFGGTIEWKILYLLAKDKDGFLEKDTIRGVYDGSVFYKLEEKRNSKKKTHN